MEAWLLRSLMHDAADTVETVLLLTEDSLSPKEGEDFCKGGEKNNAVGCW